jgi:hypothetical protein
MSDIATFAPTLVFRGWSVNFPEKGQHSFLALDDLKNPVANQTPPRHDGVWLFRAESGVCGIIPGRVRVVRNGIVVAGIASLHHGQRVELDGKSAQFCEVYRIVLSDGDRFIGRRCPFCRDAHRAGAAVLRCPLCGEGYCERCWQELTGKHCCSRSCRFSPGPLGEAA